MNKTRNFSKYILYKLRWVIILLGVCLLTVVTLFVLHYFNINDAATTTLGSILIAIFIIIFISGVYVLNKINHEMSMNIESINSQIEKLSHRLLSFTINESDIGEIKKLQGSANDAVRAFSMYHISLSPEVDMELLTNKEDFSSVISHAHFEELILPIIEYNDFYSSAVLVVEIVGKNITQAALDSLYKKIIELFGSVLVGKRRNDTLEVFLPSVASRIILENQVKQLIKEYYDFIIGVTAEDSVVNHCRAGIAIYPQSHALKLIDDATSALDKGDDVNFFIPTSPYLTRHVTEETSRYKQMVFVSQTLESAVSKIKSADEQLRYIRKNLEWFIRSFEYESGGIVQTGDGEDFRLTFEVNLGGTGGFLGKLDTLDSDVMKNLMNQCDEIGSYFGYSKFGVDEKLRPFFDNLNIESFVVFNIKLFNQNVGFCYFFSTKHHRPLSTSDSQYLYSLFVVYRSIILNYFYSNKYQQFANTVDALSKRSNQYLYSIERGGYKIIHFNNMLKSAIPSIQSGMKCYEVLYGEKEPCKNCPLISGTVIKDIPLIDNHEKSVSVLAYTDSGTQTTKECTILIENVKDEGLVNETELSYMFDPVLHIKNEKGLLADFTRFVKAGQDGAIITVEIRDFKELMKKYSQADVNVLISIMNKRIENAGYINYSYRFEEDVLVFALRTASRARSISFVEEIAMQLSEPYQVGVRNEINIGFNYSIIPFPLRVSSSSSLPRVIRESLVEARRLPANMISFVGEKMSRKAKREDYVRDVFNNALKNNKLGIFLQPILSAENEKVVGAEALLRLYGDEGELIPPMEFIPIAIESKMLLDAEKKVLEQIGELYEIHGYGIFKSVNIEYISINISKDTLNDPRLAFQIKALFKRYKFHKGFIHFEFSSSIVHDCAKRINEVFEELKGLGIVFAIDNFLLDDMPLEFLKETPITTIKINRKVIASIADQNSVTNLSRFVNKAFRSGFNIVVEGIENRNQFNAIKEMDVKLVQGYLFSKPISKDDFIKYITFKNKMN